MSGAWSVVFLALRICELLTLFAIWRMLYAIARNQVTQAQLQKLQLDELKPKSPPGRMTQGPPLKPSTRQ